MKQRVTYNEFHTRADCVEVVIDEDDFAAWAAEQGDPHTLSQSGAETVHKYVEERGITAEVGEGELEYSESSDLQLLGEEEEE